MIYDIKYESLILNLEAQEDYLKSCLRYPMRGCEDAIKYDKMHVRETNKLISEIHAWLLIVPKPEGIWVDTLDGPRYIPTTTN